MPRSFSLVAPDGKEFDLVVPDDATDADIKAKASSVKDVLARSKSKAAFDVAVPKTSSKADNTPSSLRGVVPTAEEEALKDPGLLDPTFALGAPVFLQKMLGKAAGATVAREIPELFPGLEKGIEAAGGIAKPVPTLMESLQTANAAAKAREIQGANAVTKGLSELADDIRRTLSPETRGAEAKLTHEVIGQHAAKLAAKDVQLKNQFNQAARIFDRLPDEKRLDFIAKMEQPKLGLHETPELQKIADSTRKLLDERYAKVKATSGGNVGFIEDYFPHIWKNPDEARSRVGELLGRSPLAGPKSFLRKRTIPTVADGLRLGLEPVTTNPVDLTLLKVHEMDRYIMAQELAAESKASGLIKFVRRGTKAPVGTKPINDPIAVVKQYSEEAGGFVERGKYYATEPVATIFERYLGPGLRGSKLYDTIYAPVTPINQARLSLSGFHLTLETINDLAVNTGMAVRDVVGGAVKGDIGRMASGGKRALKTVTGAQLWSDLVRGHKALQSLTEVPLGGSDILGDVGQVIQAGGRFTEDHVFARRLTASFSDAVAARKPLSIVWQGIKTLPEVLSAPIMKGFVPRVKVGAFLELAEHNLARLKPSTATEARAVLNSTWDHVDNVFGQLVRDNLFMDRKLKDLLDAVIAFPGWNIGSARLLAGVVRAPGQAVRAGITGKASSLETQMASSYALGLSTVVATTGALLQYTWTGKWPETIKDYFYPRTGRMRPDGMEERKQLPSYIRDAVGMSTHPLKTLKNKENPILSTAAELADNMDYYGREIRDPEASLLTQTGQVGEHLGTLAIPISVQNLMRSASRSPGEMLESAVGLNPPPKEITNTPAMNILDEVMQRKGMRGPFTHEEAAASQQKRDLITELRAGGDPNALAALPSSVAKQISRQAALTPLQVKFNRVGIKDALKVYAAANTQERTQLRGPLGTKLAHAMKGRDPESAMRLQREFDSLVVDKPNTLRQP